MIGGYTKGFDQVQLTDLLTVDLGNEWGSLVRTCIESTVQDRYRLTFLFAALAFSPTADLDILKSLLSYAIISDVKAIRPPDVLSFLRFSKNEVPEADSLASLMNDSMVPFVGNNAERGQLAFERLQHQKNAAYG